MALAGPRRDISPAPLGIGGADIASRVALLQETPSPVGFRVTWASAAVAVAAAALAVTQVHHVVTLAIRLC